MKETTEKMTASRCIKKELKEVFPLCLFSVTVDHSTFSDSVRIVWTDGPTETEVTAIAKKYQAGHFDGMQDMYIYDSGVSNLPRVEYISAERRYSEQVNEYISSNLSERFRIDATNDEVVQALFFISASVLLYRERRKVSFYPMAIPQEVAK